MVQVFLESLVVGIWTAWTPRSTAIKPRWLSRCCWGRLFARHPQSTGCILRQRQALSCLLLCTLVHQRAAEGCLGSSEQLCQSSELLLDTIYRATCTAGFCKATFIHTHAVPPQCNWLNVNACANYQQNGGMKGLNGFGGSARLANSTTWMQAICTPSRGLKFLTYGLLCDLHNAAWATKAVESILSVHNFLIKSISSYLKKW
jgi:hypothetical protein